MAMLEIVRQEWEKGRDRLSSNVFFRKIVDGTFSLDHYAMFLREEYFNTRDNPESFALAAFHFKGEQRSMTREIMRHVMVESGHDRMALDDLQALGYPVRETLPDRRGLPTTEAFNACFVYQVQHGRPLTYLSYIYHLESIAAEEGPSLGAHFKAIGVPPAAMTFLTEHTDSDPAHTKWNEAYLTRLVKTEKDLSDVVHGIRTACKLHGLMLQGIIEAVEQGEPEWLELDRSRAASVVASA